MSNAVTTRAADYGGPYCVSPIFGAPVCLVTTQYKQGAIVFGPVPGQPTFGIATVLDGGTLPSWAGINASNNIDLLTPINVQLVLPGTTTQATTDYLAVEAGLAAVGNLLLTVYDVNGNVLVTRHNGLDFIGPDGRSLIVIGNPPPGFPGQANPPFTGPVPGMAFFIITTSHSDVYAMNEVWIGDTVGLLSIACPIGSGTATVGVPFISSAPVVTGDTPPDTFVLLSGPPWMTIDASTGIVSGTPTYEGVVTYEIQVTDSLGNVSQVAAPCSITVSNPIPPPPFCIVVPATPQENLVLANEPLENQGT